MMTVGTIVFWIIHIFVLLMGISIGHSYLRFKIRREENRKKELELLLLDKRNEILQQGKNVAHELEELLYKAKVQQEINDIIRKDEPRR
ncbi:MAG TPA: hypothetical protein VKY57_16055 [Chitinispirillaceae bacterium]|nr:hypothetical protein [Chitinispirillaceae bacterium]